ncbi:MAG: polysaccharide biosynthesis/export family protein [Pseudomonadota bacterium]
MGFRIFVVALVVVSSLGSLAATSVASAEFRVQPGDSLRISVLGHELLSTEVMVESTGVILLPVVGELVVGDMRLAQVRSVVKDSYSGAVYRIGHESTGEVWRSVDPVGVSVDIVSFRPVYVYGDVMSPGPTEYRPGLKVLQAVASVGGPIQMIDKPRRDALIIVQLDNQSETLRRRIVHERSEIVRLRSELGELLNSEGAASAANFETSDNDADVVIDSWNLARQRARLIRDQETKETVLRLRNQIDSLALQEENALRVVDLYAQRVEDLEAAASLRPIDPQTLLDARLALLVSSSQALGFGAERANVEVELSRARLADTFEDQIEVARLIDVINGKEADLELLSMQLQGVKTERRLLSTHEPEFGAETVYEISRQVSTGDWVELAAGPETRVEPGDVIRVARASPLTSEGINFDASVVSDAVGD